MGTFVGNSTVNSSLTTTQLLVGSNSTFTMFSANATGLYANATLVANSVGPYGKTEGALNANSATFATSSGSTSQALTFSNGGSGAASGTTFNGGTARTISYNSIGAPSTTGASASGTWSISINGSAASATNASAATNATYATSAGSATNATFATSSGSTSQALTFSNGGSGAASGTTFNGGTARTISYNSIGAPSTTGASASGTWSISINGSAASATNATFASSATNASFATNSSYQSATGNTNDWVQSFQQTPAHGTSFREMSGNGPAGSWWFVQNMRHSNGGGFWGRQNAWGWEDNAHEYYSRNIQNNSFSGWVRFLHSSNYNSYSPTLTGGNASGTWSINVNGSAGSATNATYAGNSNQLNGRTFAWAGQSGQPAWLWGSNDGTNVYVWNPSNFAVASATNASYASNAGAAGSATNAGQATFASSATNSTGAISAWTSNAASGSGAFPMTIGSSQRPVDRGIIVSMNAGSGIPFLANVNNGGSQSGYLVAGIGTFSIVQSSDYRLKENIQDMDLETAAQKISNLRPVNYEWINDPDNRKWLGFLAHELQEQIPQAVHGEKDAVKEDGSIEQQGIDMVIMIPVMVGAIKKLQETVKTLQQEIEILKATINNK